MPMAGNGDAIERQRAVGTQQIWVAYLKARIQWPLFIQPLTWLATLLSPSGALSHLMLASLAKLELNNYKRLELRT